MPRLVYRPKGSGAPESARDMPDHKKPRPHVGVGRGLRLLFRETNPSHGTYRAGAAIIPSDSIGKGGALRKSWLADNIVWIVFAWVPFWATLAIYVFPKEWFMFFFVIMFAPFIMAKIYFFACLCAAPEIEHFIFFFFYSSAASVLFGGIWAPLIWGSLLIILRGLGKIIERWH